LLHQAVAAARSVPQGIDSLLAGTLRHSLAGVAKIKTGLHECSMATRLSSLKIRGFPSPSRGGFGFVHYIQFSETKTGLPLCFVATRLSSQKTRGFLSLSHDRFSFSSKWICIGTIPMNTLRVPETFHGNPAAFPRRPMVFRPHFAAGSTLSLFINSLATISGLSSYGTAQNKNRLASLSPGNPAVFSRRSVAFRPHLAVGLALVLHVINVAGTLGMSRR
jgi:hypothetical protein